MATSRTFASELPRTRLVLLVTLKVSYEGREMFLAPNPTNTTAHRSAADEKQAEARSARKDGAPSILSLPVRSSN